jgi:hypothetical protein
LLATASKDRTIKIWDPDTGLEHGTLRGHAAWITGVVFDPCGSDQLFSCSEDGVRFWRAPVGPGAGHGPDVVRRWRGPALERDVVCRGHLGDCGPLTFSPDGAALVSGGRDTTLRVWDPSTGEPIAVLGDRAWTNAAPVFDPAGGRMWLETAGAQLAEWDTRTWRRGALVPSDGARPLPLGHRPDGALVTQEAGLRSLVIRDPATGSVLDRWDFGGRQGAQGAGEPARISLSADGSALARCRHDGAVEIWDCTERRLIRRITVRATRDRAIWLDAHGRLLLTIDDEGTINVHDARTGDRLARLRPALGTILSFAMSPDGTRLATGTSVGTVLLWETSRWSPVATLRSGVNWVEGAAFSPDGRRLAACTSGGEIWVWDTEPPGARTERWRAAAQARARASAWVGRLVRELGGSDAAASAIEADTGADPDVREAALRQARSWAGSPEAMFAWAWGVLASAGADRDRYDWAFWMIRGIIHAWSRDGRHRIAEAAGQYRLGDPESALRALERAIPQVDPADTAFQTAGAALRALCLRALGRPADARAALDSARGLAATLDPATPGSAAIRSLLGEAESAVSASPGG